MPMLIGLLIVVAAVFQFFFRYEHWPSHKHDGVMVEHDALTGETYEMKPGSHSGLLARIFGSGHGGGIDGEAEGRSHYFDSFDRFGDRSGSRDGEPDDSSNGGFSELFRGHARYEKSMEGSPSLDEGPSGDQRIDLHDSRAVAHAARPVPVPRELVIASSAPPVPPMAMMAQDEDGGDSEKASAKTFAVKQFDLNHDGETEEIIQNATQSDGKLDISIVKQGREIFYGRGTQIALLPTRSSQGWTDIALKTGRHGLTVYRYSVKTGAYKALTDTAVVSDTAEASVHSRRHGA